MQTITKAFEARIKRAMALAFFASAYADLAEECDQPLRGEIMSQLPETIDNAAWHAAVTLCHGLRDKNKPNSIAQLYVFAVDNAEGDRESTPENFGHYCAMQAMGHGVGLDDAFGQTVYDTVQVPYVEFGSCSLEKDYFTGEV